VAFVFTLWLILSNNIVSCSISKKFVILKVVLIKEGPFFPERDGTFSIIKNIQTCSFEASLILIPRPAEFPQNCWGMFFS
jgi:hypothetical protein